MGLNREKAGHNTSVGLAMWVWPCFGGAKAFSEACQAHTHTHAHALTHAHAHKMHTNHTHARTHGMHVYSTVGLPCALGSMRGVQGRRARAQKPTTTHARASNLTLHKGPKRRCPTSRLQAARAQKPTTTHVRAHSCRHATPCKQVHQGLHEAGVGSACLHGHQDGLLHRLRSHTHTRTHGHTQLCSKLTTAILHGHQVGQLCCLQTTTRSGCTCCACGQEWSLWQMTLEDRSTPCDLGVLAVKGRGFWCWTVQQ